MKFLNLLIYSCLILSFGCSSNHIELKDTDVSWKYFLDYYPHIYDELLVDSNLVVLTHYSGIYGLEGYIENRIALDKESGILIKHDKAIDTLSARKIQNRERHYKYTNYSVRPKAFEINPSYNLILNTDVTRYFRHQSSRSYEFEVNVDNELYFLNLDDLDILIIDFYLSYKNELYILFKPNSKILDLSVRSYIYKINIDEILKNHLEGG